MYFAYFDESGDSGMGAKSPTKTFTLACILIHDKDWLNALDQTIAFRRFLRDQFRIPTRAELKASWLVHNTGDIKVAELTFGTRLAAYSAAMRFQRKAGLFKVFAIVVVKDRIKKRETDVRDTAWEYAIQRLERFGTTNKDNILLCPDEGHGDFLRRKVREMRRFSRVPSMFGTGPLDRRASNILEDPVERKSSDSYFIQLADLNAYASVKRVFPGPQINGSLWEELGVARVREVTGSRTAPGIVVWPEDK